jgi:diguanylate cyclase
MNRVLIIDDNASIHDDFRAILAPAEEPGTLAAARAAIFQVEVPAPAPSPRFEVVSAMQGAEGLDAVSAARACGRPFAVAFVDMRMPPGWDGLETIQRLWDEDPALQVVICTAYSDHSWKQIALTLGLTDRLLILKKPFDAAEVVQMATAMTEKWRLSKQASLKLEELEALVAARTSELSHAATHDQLTGLANRSMLAEGLGAALERARTERTWCGVYFLDFDRFKIINDTLGHAAGDKLLIEIASRLSRFDPSAVAPGAVATAARLGGDEFVMFVTAPDPPDAVAIGDRMLAELARPCMLNGYNLSTSASIGITTSHMGYTDADSALRDADTAMYRAKSLGKGRCVLFDEKMHRELKDRLALETELSGAVTRGDLVLHFQPLVSLETRELKGFEALVRWKHPQRGMISPGEFIPIAEETGAILPIGDWVLDEACRQLSEWTSRFAGARGLLMSVNVSARQLQSSQLVSRVAAALHRYNIKPEDLVLEVTESAVIDDPEYAQSVLHAIRKLGVHVYLDDFGTGYTSFSYLHKLPLTGLKMDRTFMSCLCERRDYAAVVHAIVNLSRNLGIRVVAEGIETDQQLVMLQAMDCDYGQGYLLGRPAPASVIEALIAGSMRAAA